MKKMAARKWRQKMNNALNMASALRGAQRALSAAARRRHRAYGGWPALAAVREMAAS